MQRKHYYWRCAHCGAINGMPFIVNDEKHTGGMVVRCLGSTDKGCDKWTEVSLDWLPVVTESKKSTYEGE